MNVGDKVVSINSVGTIVGVSSTGFPVVEWKFNGVEFEEHAPEELIVVG